MSGPGRTLAGRRIVVTRRRGQSGPLVALLRARGATVIEVPATAIGPPAETGALDAALRDLNRFDWLVFTSANAVGAVRERLGQLGLPTAIGARGPRIASVGAATTKAIREAFSDDAVELEPESDYRAAGLVRSFEARGCRGTAVLLPVSTRARDELPRGLRALGAEVSVVVAYATLEPPGLHEAVQSCLAEGFDVVTFAAPSAVEAFAVAAGPGAEGLPAVVIGPTTEVAARAARFSVLGKASPSTTEGLVETLERVLGPSPSAG